MADLVAALGVGDVVIEVAAGDGARLAAQVEQRIEDLPLQQAGGQPEDQRQHQRQHDHRAQEHVQHGFARQADVVGHLADDHHRLGILVAGRRPIEAVGRDATAMVVSHPVASLFDDLPGDRRIELAAGLDQRPGTGRVDQVDVDIHHVGVGLHRIGEIVLEKEPAHPPEVALLQSCAHVGRGLEDIVRPWRPVVAVGAQRAGDSRQVDAVAHDLALAEDGIEKIGEGPGGEGQPHVGGEVGLEDLVLAADEVDVLDAVLRCKGIELVDRQGDRRPARSLDLRRHRRQHLLHMGVIALVLAAQHRLEHCEALAETRLDAFQVLVLQARDQAIHGKRRHYRRAEADGHHHGEKKETDLSLHRTTGLRPVSYSATGAWCRRFRRWRRSGRRPRRFRRCGAR